MPLDERSRDAAAGRDAGWPEGCPRPPADVEDLGFERRPMVDWLSPGQLVDTGLKAAVAATFGAYADQREVQAALAPLAAEVDYDGDYSAAVSPAGERTGEEGGEGGEGGGDFWFDFAADLGDGFDPTYAVAYLLSRPALRVAGADRPLGRGRFVVLGGDQVYPTANAEAYHHRFTGPYRAAFPWRPDDRPADLYLIPGNHDWYDGLTSFTRLFTQGRWVGGWKTRQTRSYFALKLPRGWWLWGTDIQLGTGIDLPQARFFGRIADRMTAEARAAGGPARLILCTAQPTWVYCGREPERALLRGCRLAVDPAAFHALAWFERAIIAPRGIRLEVTLSGDFHHYARYERAGAGAGSGERGEEPAGPAQRITAGGGGAYLSATHHLPAAIELPVDPYGRPERRERYDRAATFPPVEASRRLGRRGWLALPFRNWRFALLLAGVYLFFAWMLQSASTAGNDLFAGIPGDGGEAPRSLTALLAQLGWRDLPAAVSAYWEVLRHSPASALFALVVLFGLRRYRLAAGGARWGAGGVVHGLAHLLLAGGLVWLAARVNHSVLGPYLEHWQEVALFFPEVFAVGGLLGGWLFGLYLTVTSRAGGAHMDEVFSSQAVTGWKSFLRLRIDPAGALHVYPIAVERVPRGREWRYRGGAPLAAGSSAEAASGPPPAADAPYRPGDPWFEPPPEWLDPSAAEPAVRLAEARPISIP